MAAAADEPEEPNGCWKCIYGCMDCIAVIFRSIINCIIAIRTCTQNCCYPIKETCLEWTDACFYHKNPWKKKIPYTHVPKFQY